MIIILFKILLALIYCFSPILILSFILEYFKKINNENRNIKGQFKKRTIIKHMNGKIEYFYIN